MNLKVYFFLLCLALSTVVSAADVFDHTRTEVLKGNREKAIALLTEGLNKNQIKGEDISLAHFALGNLLYQNGSFEEAGKHFDLALSEGTKLSDYSHLYLGRINKTLGHYDQAHQHLRQIRTTWGSKKNFQEARFEMGLLAVLEKDWHQAKLHFEYLSRRMRGTEFYPQVLWHLVLAETKLRRSWQACRWARRLYSRFPAHPLVADWGPDLQTAKVAGESLGCFATLNDIKARIQNLSWAGEPERARAEIDILRKKSSPNSEYFADNIYTEYLVDEGMVEEALPILAKYFDEKKNNLDYLMLLGKAASRAQRYQLAASAFQRAYELSPNSKTGRMALFRAAFTSYQFQDYDGAARKFILVKERFRRSGLVRDAQWHMAWIRYLKGDYDGAYKSFSELKYTTIRKNRRGKRYVVASNLSKDKVKYWMAMSLLRMGKPVQATPMFEELMRDGSNGYYNILAKSRLTEMPKIAAGEARAPAQSTAENASASDGAKEEVASSDNDDKEGVSEEDESEETATSDNEDQDEEVAEGEEPSGSDAEEEAKDTMVSMSFGNPEFIRKYQRAQDLIRVGFYDSARWELYDIEGRIRDPKKLRMLISQYEAIESFNRAEYVSFVVLANERTKKGLDGAKDLWEAAFPRAYSSLAKNAASDFAVPLYFVWSIIRAESQFKVDAKSPTGALGLMQIMPNTAKQVARLLKDEGFHTEQLMDPQTNIRLGTRYLGKLVKKFTGQLPLVAAAYNAGPHRVDSWLMTFGNLDMDEFVEHIPFIETRDYVKRVVSNYFNYDLVYGGKASTMVWAVAPVGTNGNTFSAYRELWD